MKIASTFNPKDLKNIEILMKTGKFDNITEAITAAVGNMAFIEKKKNEGFKVSVVCEKPQKNEEKFSLEMK